VTHLKLQKSQKGDITEQAMWVIISPFLMIFAVLDLDLSLAVNLCINCNFYIIICRNQALFVALFACYCSISNTVISAFSLIHGGDVILAIAGTYFWPWPDLCP